MKAWKGQAWLDQTRQVSLLKWGDDELQGVSGSEICDLLACSAIGGGMITGSSLAEHVLRLSKGSMDKSVDGGVEGL